MPAHPAVSSTRLLVLGAVHIMEPAHGYLVMRELSTWKVDEWASLKPGSIYNALRSLTKGGLLTEARAEDERGSGGKSVYRLTPDGRTELETLVREAIWRVHPWDPSILMSGVSFWWLLTRQEVLDALEARRTQIVAWLSANRYAEEGVQRNPTTPPHVAEHFKLAGARMQGELEWTDAVARRVKDGEYAFRGEELIEYLGPGDPAGAHPVEPPI